MTSSSTPTKHPKPRNRPIRVRRLWAGFRAVVAKQAYTEPTISALLDRLNTAGYQQRQISWLHYQPYCLVKRFHFNSVQEAAWFVSAFKHPAGQLGRITGAQLSKIEALGGMMIPVRVNSHNYNELFYVFEDHVIGTMTIAHFERQNQLANSAMWRAWRRLADECPMLEDVANRYFNDNEPGTVDLLRVTARFAA